MHLAALTSAATLLDDHSQNGAAEPNPASTPHKSPTRWWARVARGDESARQRPRSGSTPVGC
jgi:hypothetical protein